MAKSSITTSLLCLAGFSSLSEAAFNWANIQSVVSFGDSYSAIQGTAGLAGSYSFIGSYLPDQLAFNKTTLLNNKIIQNFTGTAEGGPNWLEQLTGCGINNGTLTAPRDCSIQLWDFAFFGASFSQEFFPLHHLYTIPVVNQTQQYLTYADPVLSLNKSKSLVTIWFGINDIYDTKTFYKGNLTTEQYWTELIGAAFEQVVTPMLDSGFQNFLMPNLPPMDRIPSNLRAAIPYPTPAIINIWNSVLSQQAQAFQSNNTGSKVMVYDANTFLNTVLNNPQKYKIKNTSTYCRNNTNPAVQYNAGAYGCLPIDQYFWFSGAHTTSYVHQLMVADLKKFLKTQAS